MYHSLQMIAQDALIINNVGVIVVIDNYWCYYHNCCNCTKLLVFGHFIIIVVVLVVRLAIPGLGQASPGHTAPVIVIVLPIVLIIVIAIISLYQPNCPAIYIIVMVITIVAINCPMTLNEYEYKISYYCHYLSQLSLLLLLLLYRSISWAINVKFMLLFLSISNLLIVLLN